MCTHIWFTFFSFVSYCYVSPVTLFGSTPNFDLYRNLVSLLSRSSFNKIWIKIFIIPTAVRSWLMIPRDLTAREDLNLNHNIKITFIKGLWITVGIVKMSLVATVMSVSFFILSYGCVCVCVYIFPTLVYVICIMMLLYCTSVLQWLLYHNIKYLWRVLILRPSSKRIWS